MGRLQSCIMYHVPISNHNEAIHLVGKKHVCDHHNHRRRHRHRHRHCRDREEYVRLCAIVDTSGEH